MTTDTYLRRDTGKDDGPAGSTTTDPSKYKYKLGVRFFNETDKQQLVYSYFKLLGQPVDDHILHEIREEMAKDFQVEATPIEADDEAESRGDKRQRMTSSSSASATPAMQSSSSSSASSIGGGRRASSSTSVAAVVVGSPADASLRRSSRSMR
jgi:hypothetical protein